MTRPPDRYWLFVLTSEMTWSKLVVMLAQDVMGSPGALVDLLEQLKFACGGPRLTVLKTLKASARNLMRAPSRNMGKPNSRPTPNVGRINAGPLKELRRMVL